MAQVSIDPKLWATVRKLAFDRQVTASRLVSTAIEEYLARQEKPQGGLANWISPDEARVLVGLDPREQLPSESLVPTAVIPVMEEELRAKTVTKTFKAIGEAVIGQDALPPPAVIKDPKEAAAAVKAVAAGREFHPVPKPVSAKRARR